MLIRQRGRPDQGEQLDGRRGPRLAAQARSQAIRAFARLESGLSDYATRGD